MQEFEKCERSKLLALDATNMEGTIGCMHIGEIGVLHKHARHHGIEVDLLNNSKICIALALSWPPYRNKNKTMLEIWMLTLSI